VTLEQVHTFTEPILYRFDLVFALVGISVSDLTSRFQPGVKQVLGMAVSSCWNPACHSWWGVSSFYRQYIASKRQRGLYCYTSDFI